MLGSATLDIVLGLSLCEHMYMQDSAYCRCLKRVSRAAYLKRLQRLPAKVAGDDDGVEGPGFWLRPLQPEHAHEHMRDMRRECQDVCCRQQAYLLYNELLHVTDQL